LYVNVYHKYIELIKTGCVKYVHQIRYNIQNVKFAHIILLYGAITIFLQWISPSIIWKTIWWFWRHTQILSVSIGSSI